MDKLSSLKTIDDIINLYQEFGNSDYIGEEVTQVEHAVQGALLAQQEGYDNETIIGVLLHDVGHLVGLKFNLEQMDNLGALFHETIGFQLLKQIGMKEKVCLLVKNHVNAKRYLVAKNQDYYSSLSEASKGTLYFQGGKMSEEEVKEFELNPHKELILRMRNWDDKAKVKGMEIPDFCYFREMMISCLEK